MPYRVVDNLNLSIFFNKGWTIMNINKKSIKKEVVNFNIESILVSVLQ